MDFSASRNVTQSIKLSDADWMQSRHLIPFSHLSHIIYTQTRSISYFLFQVIIETIVTMKMYGFENRHTATAASAAYARALEGATEAKNTSSDKLYSQRKEYIENRQYVESRDQGPETYNREEMDYRLTAGVDSEAKNLLENILNLDTEVTEATAAVYHYFETKKVDDDISPSDRATAVILSIKQQLLRGNAKPAYQFLETAKSVLPILLEEREEIGLQMEENIFKDGDAQKPEDHEQDDVRSVSEQSQAIFQFLDDGAATQLEDHVELNVSDDMEQKPNVTPDGIYGNGPIEFEDPSQAPNTDEMDLEFVENFDLAYSEFLFYHPNLVAKNPKLLKNLRIYKLQKMLDYNETLERANLGKLNVTFEEKKATEESMQMELKDAVKSKAARQTHLQSEVNNINWKTKQLQAKLRWKLFSLSEDRSKRQSTLREQYKDIPEATGRHDLIRLIPDGPHSQKLETTVKASLIAQGSPQPHEMTTKKLDQLRKLQVENSVMNSEILIVSQKLDRLRQEAEKLQWVESTLMELDPVAVHKFKKRFEKTEGVKL